MTRSAEARDFELEEQKHRQWFRAVMLFVLPIVALGWLGLIAFMTFTERITGLHVGLPLGLTAAGLLTLVGLQIAWAHSQKSTANTHPATATLESIRKLVGD